MADDTFNPEKCNVFSLGSARGSANVEQNKDIRIGRFGI